MVAACELTGLHSYAVGKIAIHDVPDQWPDLIPTLMNAIPNGTDPQVHGALRTIQDIVEDSLNESQFFSMAREITAAVSSVAFDKNRSYTLRALAISIFRQCFVLIDTVKGEYMDEVLQFSEELLTTWHPFFMGILEEHLPPPAQTEPRSQPPNWDGPIMLKLQVLKTLLKIKMVLPKVLTPRALDYFGAVWGDLITFMDLHKELYIDNETLDRLEDVDGLPYSFDFLVLEALDVMHQFLKAKPIDEKLRQQLAESASPAQTQWMMQMMQMLTAFSRITQEEEGLWDIDCSLYLAEEASASANYTSRTCAGDVLIKLGELYNQTALEGLVAYTKLLFETSSPDWRSQEAALYLFNMIAGDFADTEKIIPQQTSEAYLSLVDHAVSQSDSPFLRARGFLVGSTLTRVYSTPDTLITRTLSCINNNDEAEVVRVSCIKAVEHIVMAKRIPEQQQVPTIMAIHQYIQSKDSDELEEADELLVTLMEALRMVVNVNPAIALSDSVQALEILFMLGRVGAANFQVTLLVSEALESIVAALSTPDNYTALSRKVLPLLLPAFDLPDLTGDQPNVVVAVELLVVLVTGGTEPLPVGFVAACLPKLKRLLLESDEGEVLRPAAEALKFLLMHDHQQVFEWADQDGRSGLEVCLRVLDRLLAPTMEDNSASEAGGLAAELVEKAGHERLGPFLPELLKVVASRLATATSAAFIQSLILVFARLSLLGAQDVVEFLSQCQIGDQSGLEVVIPKWLENSVVFAGYDEIRQK
jgi:importin-9